MEGNSLMDGAKLLLSVGSFMLALIGGIVLRDRQVMRKISESNARSHERIDELKDELNANFARKDDVKESVRRVERSIENLGNEMRQNHKDLTALIVKKI